VHNRKPPVLYQTRYAAMGATRPRTKYPNFRVGFLLSIILYYPAEWMRTQDSLLETAIHFVAAADRVLLRVELRDSRGRLWMKGLMAQLRAAGMLRDSESVRHSATTPSLAVSKLQ
jgi:hypothetical protein